MFVELVRALLEKSDVQGEEVLRKKQARIQLEVGEVRGYGPSGVRKREVGRGGGGK